MRIRGSFLLFVILIGIIVLGLAGWVIRDGYSERSNAVAARGLAATQGELLRLVELIGIERGAYNAALREDKTADPNGATFADPRKKTDDTIAAALAAARASGHAAIDLPSIQALQAGLQDWRKKVEAAITRPLAERPADVMNGYVPALAEMVGKLTPLLNRIDSAISRSDDDVALPMTIARLAADMRAEASIRGTTTVNVIASGKPFPPATRIFVGEQSGKVDAVWARIVMAMGMIDASANLKEKAEQTRKGFYVDLKQLLDSVYAASDKGEAYPFANIAEFRNKQNPLLYTAGYLRDAAIEEALKVADALIEQRTRHVLIEVVVALIAVLLLMSGAIYFVRRVVSPLGNITHTMTQIAEGQAAEIGYADRRDEIGDMAQALGVFQRNAEEKGPAGRRGAQPRRGRESPPGEPARSRSGDQPGNRPVLHGGRRWRFLTPHRPGRQGWRVPRPVAADERSGRYAAECARRSRPCAARPQPW
jgi:HAMP domain-containing protein